MKMKTLKTLISEGYRLPTVLDQATRELVKTWFNNRYVVNTDYLDREIELHYPYYLEMLKVDPTMNTVDWYIEILSNRDVESTNENTSASETTSTKVHDGSLTTDRTTNGSSNHSSKHDSADNSAARDTTQMRSNPMSASYTSANENEFAGNVSVNGGEYSLRKPAQYIAAGHVLNPTATNDNFNENVSVGQSKDSGNESYSNNDHMTNSREATDTTNGSGTVTDNGSGTVSETLSGRHQLPASVISGAMACIGASESWNWFMKQIDKGFMMIYNNDMEEYDYE